jgi:hypothetical protein
MTQHIEVDIRPRWEGCRQPGKPPFHTSSSHRVLLYIDQPGPTLAEMMPTFPPDSSERSGQIPHALQM